MKKVYLFVSMAIFSTYGVRAQLNESFSDGNFNAGVHVWNGTTSNWQVVPSSDVSAGATNSNTLRLNGPSGGSGTQYLSTQLPGSWSIGQTWAFWLGRRTQAVTSTNRSYFWLYANAADVTAATTDGYRVSLGDDTGDDNLVLESVTNGVATPVITSVTAVPDGLEDYGILVRVTRTAAGLWSMFTSILPLASGTGPVATDFPSIVNTPVAQGVAVNNDYPVLDNGFIAVAALHTNSANARAGAEFDQIRVVFAANAPLPVTISLLKAYEKMNGIQLDWKAYSEVNLSHYEIERSADGRNFSKIGEVAGLNSMSEVNYSYFDPQPLPGTGFYRLRSVDIDDKASYSIVVRVSLDKDDQQFRIYPNPTSTGYISMQTAALAKGEYSTRIFNLAGQQVFLFRFSHSGGSINQSIQLPPGIRSGIYHLQLERGEERILNKPFTIQ